MKKQWLSIVLVLCMVLCLAPNGASRGDGYAEDHREGIGTG